MMTKIKISFLFIGLLSIVGIALARQNASHPGFVYPIEYRLVGKTDPIISKIINLAADNVNNGIGKKIFLNSEKINASISEVLSTKPVLIFEIVSKRKSIPPASKIPHRMDIGNNIVKILRENTSLESTESEKVGMRIGVNAFSKSGDPEVLECKTIRISVEKMAILGFSQIYIGQTPGNFYLCVLAAFFHHISPKFDLWKNITMKSENINIQDPAILRQVVSEKFLDEVIMYLQH